MQTAQIIYVKCPNYQWYENVTTDKSNVNPPFIREEVSLILRRLKVIRSLPPPDDFEPSENQATKKWKWVLTPPPRETQTGEYEVIVAVFPRHARAGGTRTLV